MIDVKICGITCEEDARAAEEAGARAIGFVFAPSPRRVSPRKAREISQALGRGPARVGVFVNEPLDEIRRIAETVPLDCVQVHGTPLRCRTANLGLPVISAYRTRNADVLDHIRREHPHVFLLDAYVPGQEGGTGMLADLRLARQARELGPMVLAGGLHPGNVAEVLRIVEPRGVDVSTGVEDRPGVKNHEKIQNFLSEVRQWKRQKDTSADSADALFPRRCRRH